MGMDAKELAQLMVTAGLIICCSGIYLVLGVVAIVIASINLSHLGGIPEDDRRNAIILLSMLIVGGVIHSLTPIIAFSIHAKFQGKIASRLTLYSDILQLCLFVGCLTGGVLYAEKMFYYPPLMIIAVIIIVAKVIMLPYLTCVVFKENDGNDETGRLVQEENPA